MDNKSWGDNKLSADFNGRFLTLMKYGTMTGETSGSYSDDGRWGASSQGYWQKSGQNGGDLAFASMIQGRSILLRRQQSGYYYNTASSSYYNYSMSDPAETQRWGNSTLSNALNNSTFVRFDRQGPTGTSYFKETWTTTDGGATWNYATPVYYADEAAYNTALNGIATQPSGSWTPGSTTDYYHLDNYSNFGGIFGGLNVNLWTEKTSPILLQGTFDWMGNRKTSPSLATGDILSFNPMVNIDPWGNSTSRIGGAYRGVMGVAVDSTNKLSGGLMALYQDPSGNGGVLYSDNITGVIHPAVGAWTAEGNINLYPMTATPLTTGANVFTQTVQSNQYDRSYASGQSDVGRRTASETSQSISGQPWGIWHMASGGTYTGTQGISTEQRIGEYIASGFAKDVYNHISWGTPVNGITPGTVAGAQIIQNSISATGSYTMVHGGVVKGLFDPATTPMTWTIISQGGYMETSAFRVKQAAMDDTAKANFERAMKIPTFDVGTANLGGNNGNLYVNIAGIKFFRFQGEANPRIWAAGSPAGAPSTTTGVAYGSYTSNPTIGTTVPLTSSGGLSGLKHTFEVKQWDTINNNWGASIYRGATDMASGTTGTLTRTETRTLPAGATATIPITEMRGGAAGTIKPGVSITATTGLPGPNSFGGTAAGTVK
jgi:hypothetical protein